MQYRNTCAEMLYLCIYLRWKHARVSMDFSMASSSANLLTANNGRRESANRVAMTLGKSSQPRFSMVKCEWASGVREEADASVEYNEYKTYICGGDTSIYYIITVRRCMWSSSSSLPGHHTVHGVMSAKPQRVRGGGAEEEPVTTRSTRLTTMSSSAHRYAQPISVLSSHDMVASLSGRPLEEISRGCWLAMAADR